MSKRNKFTIRQYAWADAPAALRQIREQVFIVEQHVPIELEWDDMDASALHLLAFNEQQQAIACARVLPDGHIGRMAVLADYRGLGAGMQLLQHAIAICQMQQWLPVRLSAQNHAIPFYEKAGFVVCSEEYMDAGIPHHDMVWEAKRSI